MGDPLQKKIQDIWVVCLHESEFSFNDRFFSYRKYPNGWFSGGVVYWHSWSIRGKKGIDNAHFWMDFPKLFLIALRLFLRSEGVSCSAMAWEGPSSLFNQMSSSLTPRFFLSNSVINSQSVFPFSYKLYLQTKVNPFFVMVSLLTLLCNM